MTDRLDDRIHGLMQLVVDETPPPPVLPEAPAGAWRPPVTGWAIAAVAAAVVLVVVGGLSFVFGGSEGSVPPADDQVPGPSTSTLLEGSSVETVISTVEARLQGIPFEPGVHELCEWFDESEIREIVATAYSASGVDWGGIPGALEAQSSWEYRFVGIPEGNSGCQWVNPDESGGFAVDRFDVSFIPLTVEEWEAVAEQNQVPGGGLQWSHLLPARSRDGVFSESGWCCGGGIRIPGCQQFVFVEQRGGVAFNNNPGFNDATILDNYEQGQIEALDAGAEVGIRIAFGMLERMNWIPPVND